MLGHLYHLPVPWLEWGSTAHTWAWTVVAHTGAWTVGAIFIAFAVVLYTALLQFSLKLFYVLFDMTANLSEIQKLYKKYIWFPPGLARSP